MQVKLALARPPMKPCFCRLGTLAPAFLKRSACWYFNPFYRALGTEADGSGLGLPIVRKIAQRHQAEVSIGATTKAKHRLARCSTFHFQPVCWMLTMQNNEVAVNWLIATLKRGILFHLVDTLLIANY